MFFESFPVTFHKTINGEFVLVTDFIQAIRIPDEILNDFNLYTYYMVEDNETPEIISHKFYKSTAYHWTIMAINQRYDVWEDYPKSDAILREVCLEKYNSVDGVHHYIDGDGNIVDSFDISGIPVTNIEHELIENEKKRMIKVLRPELISEFVSEYTRLIEANNV